MAAGAILSEQKRKAVFVVGCVAAVVLACGALIAPERAWSNLLIAAFGLVTAALGGGVFLALTYVCGAGWHVAFRRVPEALAMLIPAAGVGVLLVLALRAQQYGWHHHGGGDAGTFWFKQLWLTPWFWFARSLGYLAIWSLLAAWLVRKPGENQTRSSQPAWLTGKVRLSAFFLAVYAVTFSLASVDWLMALEPMWFSTMWGVYNFAGMVLAALAVIVLLCLRLSGPGQPLHGIFSVEHLHDLGRLMLGFSCFWMYIWFSQYMLIWYSNIPEETSYFITRTHGPWGPVVVAAIVLNWVLPFFVLLPRPAKRSARVMTKVAIVLLIGRWCDLYLMVLPSTLGDAPAFGLWEVAGIALAAAAGLLLIDRSFPAADPVPANDVYLPESMHYHA